VAEQVGRHRRIGGAPSLLHDLAEEGVDGALLPAAELIDRAGVLGDDLVDDGLEGRGVRDLPKSLRFDDLLDARAGGERFGERGLSRGRRQTAL
jgi:hypothetical protein